MCEGQKAHVCSSRAVLIKEVLKVVLAVFFKTKGLNSEVDILPLLRRLPAFRGLQCKVLDDQPWQQHHLFVLHLVSPVLRIVRKEKHNTMSTTMQAYVFSMCVRARPGNTV